ncbi:histone acetylation protein-domain-containing protein [Hypoxylon trugodes]|uniref:histone acetylation protein-domain-containing protein n=1 Tax=Hypoxylon trugodes TaxID=326681 RepID=UPI00219E342C|nr:histone acetylation protein-domain-containing protein [Hypoxylon trugodes]KAI1390754.1 histone acetylation protein-domain-containing protein [Hypoxylon trugodes]
MSITAQVHDREGERAVNPHPLVVELAKVLPKDRKFTAYHVSTPPVNADPLFHSPAYNPTSSSTPSDETKSKSISRRPSKPLKTYCEKHFLAISIDAGNKEKSTEGQVLVLGLEIYIYTTRFSTIVFVSKADSTGYLNLLELPKGTPSPIREVTACFLAYLIANRKRPTKQLVVNLFARAQSQYLFPGSVKNKDKHILDDKGLVKWWCRVLNSLLEGDDYSDVKQTWDKIHGYLVIPGLDNYETRAFLPRTSVASTNWTLGHPLENISPYTKDQNIYGPVIYPRCLIPIFPDDPKARFVEELEESTSEMTKLLSGWKSPKTLEQFWEMMAFRQECSSGRLTGFIWVVFDPPVAPNPATKSAAVIPTPDTSFSAPQVNGEAPTTSIALPLESTQKTKKGLRKRKGKKKKLTGPIIPRKPHVKTHMGPQFPKDTETPYYSWPEHGRGQVVLADTGYKRAIELLLHLEFGTLEQATASTARWSGEVGMGKNWTLEIIGERAAVNPNPTASSTSDGAVNNLSGMVRRKRGSDDQTAADASPSTSPVTTLLGKGVVRKKAKLDYDSTAATSA